MPANQRTVHDLRCFCSRHPILARYGVDENGDLYIWVKIWKQNRIFGEIVVNAGRVKLHCRECLRWHSVTMRGPDKTPQLTEVRTPAELDG
jgi:hypothetical protein